MGSSPAGSLFGSAARAWRDYARDLRALDPAEVRARRRFTLLLFALLMLGTLAALPMGRLWPPGVLVAGAVASGLLRRGAATDRARAVLTDLQVLAALAALAVLGVTLSAR